LPQFFKEMEKSRQYFPRVSHWHLNGISLTGNFNLLCARFAFILKRVNQRSSFMKKFIGLFILCAMSFAGSVQAGTTQAARKPADARGYLPVYVNWASGQTEHDALLVCDDIDYSGFDVFVPGKISADAFDTTSGCDVGWQNLGQKTVQGKNGVYTRVRFDVGTPSNPWKGEDCSIIVKQKSSGKTFTINGSGC
jgi:hypothetical protein